MLCILHNGICVLSNACAVGPSEKPTVFSCKSDIYFTPYSVIHKYYGMYFIYLHLCFTHALFFFICVAQILDILFIFHQSFTTRAVGPPETTLDFLLCVHAVLSGTVISNTPS